MLYLNLLGILVVITCGGNLWTNGVPQFRVAREPGRMQGSFFFHINDGFHYHKNSEVEGTIYFKCVRYEQGCRGRARFDLAEGFVHSATSRHNHDPDMYYPDEMALRNRIIRRCERLEYVGYQQIIDEESDGFVFFFLLCCLLL